MGEQGTCVKSFEVKQVLPFKLLQGGITIIANCLKNSNWGRGEVGVWRGGGRGKGGVWGGGRGVWGENNYVC